MVSLMDVLRGRSGPGAPAAAQAWLHGLFKAPLSPLVLGPDGEVRVWKAGAAAGGATVTDQFKANAEEYHRRYAASDHFEALFRQALGATGAEVAPQPLILDLGSGSGVNSVIPCRRLFAGARVVASDLSAELLAMLAAYAADAGEAAAIACVRMDAMKALTQPGVFDLVTGAAILHHLDSPGEGLRTAGRALKPGGHAIFFEPFNGWALLRLAFERILAEAQLRADPLPEDVAQGLRRLVEDVAYRSTESYRLDRSAKDDKWLFSRTGVEAMARAAGFAEVRFAPHADHATLFRDTAGVQLRLVSGRDDLLLPDWALDILDGFDAAMTLNAKRELMLEGSIVLTKAR
jgi:SAM-dependent methyltransferase